jgi:hypothetical protein
LDFGVLTSDSVPIDVKRGFGFLARSSVNGIYLFSALDLPFNLSLSPSIIGLLARRVPSDDAYADFMANLTKSSTPTKSMSNLLTNLTYVYALPSYGWMLKRVKYLSVI